MAVYGQYTDNPSVAGYVHAPQYFDSAEAILRRAGVSTAKGVSIWSRGQLEQAQRTEARANRDFNTLVNRLHLPGYAGRTEEGLAAQRDERLRVAANTRANVAEVQEAWRVEQAFRSKTQEQRDQEASQAAANVWIGPANPPHVTTQPLASILQAFGGDVEAARASGANVPVERDTPQATAEIQAALERWNKSARTQADTDAFLEQLRRFVSQGRLTEELYRQFVEETRQAQQSFAISQAALASGGAVPAPDSIDPQVAALQTQIEVIHRELAQAQADLQAGVLADQQAKVLAQKQAEQAALEQAQERQRLADERQRFIQDVSSRVRGTLGGTMLQSPIGGLFGTEGIEVGPAVASLAAGRVLEQPGSLLASIGLRPPSAQALSRMTPLEFGEFAEVGRLAGIPSDVFASEMTLAVPGRRQPGTFAQTPGRMRLF